MNIAGLNIKDKETFYNELQIPDFLADDDCFEIVLKAIKSSRLGEAEYESQRLLKWLLHSIKSARYNLFEALFSDQFFIDESIANDKEWYIGNSLYNSIMWYNTTFDIVLQFIWVHYRFFEKINSAQSFNFENSQAQNIFKKCRYESIEKLYSRTTFTLFNELKGLNNFITDIREWTNNIKHRGAFRITDIPISEGFNLKTVKELNPKDPEKEQIVYNSDKSIIKKSAKDITTLLMEYHKNLYSFIDTLFQESNRNKS